MRGCSSATPRAGALLPASRACLHSTLLFALPPQLHNPPYPPRAASFLLLAWPHVFHPPCHSCPCPGPVDGGESMGTRLWLWTIRSISKAAGLHACWLLVVVPLRCLPSRHPQQAHQGCGPVSAHTYSHTCTHACRLTPTLTHAHTHARMHAGSHPLSHKHTHTPRLTWNTWSVWPRVGRKLASGCGGRVQREAGWDGAFTLAVKGRGARCLLPAWARGVAMFFSAGLTESVVSSLARAPHAVQCVRCSA